MDTKLKLLVDTFIQNRQPTHYANEVVVTPLTEPIATVAKARRQKAAIEADPRLTSVGKSDARCEAGRAALAAIKKWHAPKLVDLDADITSQRMALMPKGPEPDARKVDFMLGLMQKHTSQELATFYDKATDPERILMEAASASVGRMPLKTAAGLQWQPLLNPESVTESLIARATATNPAAVQKVTELESIRDMHKTVAAHAAAEIIEVFTGDRLT